MDPHAVALLAKERTPYDELCYMRSLQKRRFAPIPCLALHPACLSTSRKIIDGLPQMSG
jgi:hypothetical protein